MEQLKELYEEERAKLYGITGSHPGIERYVVTTPETREICTDALLYGEPYTRRLQAGLTKALTLLSKHYQKTHQQRFLDGIPDSRINILNILTGSEAWRIKEALSEAYDRHCPKESHIWSKRYKDGDGEWDIEIYKDKIIAGKGDVLHVGDIVASGITLEKLMPFILQRYDKAGADIESFVLFTIGGDQAERVFEKYMDQFKERNPDFTAKVIYLEGRFTIAEGDRKIEVNGTELDYLTEGTDLLLPGALVAPELLLEDYQDLIFSLEKCRAYYGSRRHARPVEHLVELKEAWLAMRGRAYGGLDMYGALEEKSLFPPEISPAEFISIAGGMWPDSDTGQLWRLHQDRFDNASNNPGDLVKMCDMRLETIAEHLSRV
ncbi:MAG: hypothetical protein KJ709_01060 [Nanoarchaeota archaeon]|nr:hypothetical protein [Nanoarchaeota archaeon]